MPWAWEVMRPRQGLGGARAEEEQGRSEERKGLEFHGVTISIDD
jgi:hypothetical protein